MKYGRYTIRDQIRCFKIDFVDLLVRELAVTGIFTALGALAGGFLLSPPPKAVLSTLVWLGQRSHPVVTLAATVAILAAWRKPDG